MPRQRFRSSSGANLAEMKNTSSAPSSSLSSSSSENMILSSLFDIWIQMRDRNDRTFFHYNHKNEPVEFISCMQKILHLASLLDRNNNVHASHALTTNTTTTNNNNNNSNGSQNESLLEKLLLTQDKESGYTPLHKAMLHSDITMILKLLRHAALSNDIHDPNTLFYELKGRGRLAYRPMNMLQGDVNNKVLQKLVSCKDYEGLTPLDLLCEMQQRELAQCRKVLKLDARLDDIGVRRLSSNDEDNDDEEEKEEEFELEEDNNNEFHALQHRSNLSSMDHTNDNNDTIQSSSHQYGCEVFTFGRANHCALGVFRSSDSSASNDTTSNITSKKSSSPRIQRVTTFALADLGHENSATAIAASSHHTLVSTKNGHLYAFGLGKGGRLGTGDERNQPLPIRIMGPLSRRVVTSIAAAENHSLCTTNEGMVYGWGSNRFGQLGTFKGEDNNQNVSQQQRCIPRRVESLKHVYCVKVAAGDRHSVALSRKGEVYCWGDNQAGQLGTSPRSNNLGIGNNTSSTSGGVLQAIRANALWESEPKKIAIAISASEQSTMVLTRPPQNNGKMLSKNTVYAWGYGNHIPIRVNFNSSNQDGSTLETSHTNPISIACAKHHNVAVMSDGRVFTWGLHTDHLGHNKNNSKQKNSHRSSMILASPQLVTGMLPENGGGIAVAVSASDSHTAILTDCGHLYTWGVNDCKHALGHEGVRWQPLPKKVPGVFRAVNIAVAKEHTVLLVGTSFPPIKESHLESSEEENHNNNVAPSLETASGKVVAQHVDLFNVIPTLITAERIQCHFLIEYCKDFIRCNLDGVLTVGRKSEMDCYLNETLQDMSMDLQDDMKHLNHDDDETCHPLIWEILKSIDNDGFLGKNKSVSLWTERCATLMRFVPSRLLFQHDKTKPLSRSRSQSFQNNEDISMLQSRQRSRTLSFNGNDLISSDYNNYNPQQKPERKLSNVCDNAVMLPIGGIHECSDRCIMLTSNMNLKTVQAVESKYTSLTKEVRSIRKRLNQIEKLEETLNSNTALSLTEDQQEKLAKRSLFEADLNHYDRALKEVTVKMRQLGVEKLEPKNYVKIEAEVETTPPITILNEKFEMIQKEEDIKDKKSSSEPASKPPPEYRCAICNITCPDLSSFELHNSGRKHANRIKQAEEKEKQEMAAAMMEQKQRQLMMKGATLAAAPTTKQQKNPWETKKETQTIQPKYKLQPPPKMVPDEKPAAKSKWPFPANFNEVISTPKRSPGDKKYTSFSQIIEEEQKKLALSQKKSSVKAQLQLPPTPLSHEKLRSPAFVYKSTPTKLSMESTWKTSSPSTTRVPTPVYAAKLPPRSSAERLDCKNNLWLGDFVVNKNERLKAAANPPTPNWSTSSALKKESSTLKTTTPQKSLLEIQVEEENLRTQQDLSYTPDGSWYVERRKRAESLSTIQDEAKKQREMELLVEEQRQIEEQIQRELKEQQQQKNKKHRKPNSKNNKPKSGTKNNKSPGNGYVQNSGEGEKEVSLKKKMNKQNVHKKKNSVGENRPSQNKKNGNGIKPGPPNKVTKSSDA